MAGKRKLTKTLIKEILNEGIFDPEDTIFKIIVSLQDPHYCEVKAIELIREAQLVCYQAAGPVSPEYHHKISQATAILALARFYRGANGTVRSKKHKT